ncbi:MAG: radical SAM protein [Candidatus Levybacteria bacterium]|nr:radical SAM protein [Candidatus Levybacteria bacterium]
MNPEARAGARIEDTLHRGIGEFALHRMKPISIETVAKEKQAKGGDLQLYVHIPFCTEICSFCAFHRQIDNGAKKENYIQGLEEHIESTLALFESSDISSISVGGGTPGLLMPGQVKRVFSAIRQTTSSDNVSITYELHPENITSEYIQSLMELGVTRFSVGIQNMSEEERKVLKRTLTTGDQDIARLQLLNVLGVNYNLDLMFGTPTQTLESWLSTLSRVVEEVNPPEITTYQYVNAYGSETRKSVMQGKLSLPGFSATHRMYDATKVYLKDHGYHQTNVQSFSRTENRPRQLLGQGSDFLGLGPKTYSKIGRCLFLNKGITSDFTREKDTQTYYGIALPESLFRLLDKSFGIIANTVNGEGLLSANLGSWQSEVITQTYAILYYIINHSNLSSEDR